MQTEEQKILLQSARIAVSARGLDRELGSDPGRPAQFTTFLEDLERDVRDLRLLLKEGEHLTRVEITGSSG